MYKFFFQTLLHFASFPLLGSTTSLQQVPNFSSLLLRCSLSPCQSFLISVFSSSPHSLAHLTKNNEAFIIFYPSKTNLYFSFFGAIIRSIYAFIYISMQPLGLEAYTASSKFFHPQVTSASTKKFVHSCHARHILSRFGYLERSLQLNFYASRIGRIKNLSYSASDYPAQGTIFLILSSLLRTPCVCGFRQQILFT